MCKFQLAENACNSAHTQKNLSVHVKITLHGIARENGRSRKIREAHVCLDTVGKGNEELFGFLGLETRFP